VIPVGARVYHPRYGSGNLLGYLYKKQRCVVLFSGNKRVVLQPGTLREIPEGAVVPPGGHRKKSIQKKASEKEQPKKEAAQKAAAPAKDKDYRAVVSRILSSWEEKKKTDEEPSPAPVPLKFTEKPELLDITLDESPIKIGDALTTRSVVESFRLGIVPQGAITSFTVGRDREIEKITRWLDDPLSGTLVATGSYGSGKSHLVEYLYSYASGQKFATTKASLDPSETQAAFPKRVYRSLIQNFRCPYEGELLDFRGTLSAVASRTSSAFLSDHFFFKHIFPRLKDGEETTEFWDWVEGRDARRSVGRYLYDHTTAANIYCNILSCLGWMVTNILDLKGLLILLDEAEVVDIHKYAYELKRGLNFLRGLSLVAGDDPDAAEETVALDGICYTGRNTRLTYSGHLRVPYIHEISSHIKLFLAMTPTPLINRLDLHPSYQPLLLESLGLDELKSFFEKFISFYLEAYGLLPRERDYKKIFFLMQQIRFDSTRSVIKAMVEMLDFKRHFPDKKLKSLFK